jgi:hypothetical protein
MNRLDVEGILDHLEASFVRTTYNPEDVDQHLRTYEHVILDRPELKGKIWAVRVEAADNGYRDADDLRRKLILKGIVTPTEDESNVWFQTRKTVRELLSEPRAKKAGKGHLDTFVPSEDLWVFFTDEERAASFRADVNAFFLARMNKIAEAFDL